MNDLIRAVKNKDKRAALHAIDDGADLNQKGGLYDQTPVIYAIMYDQFEILHMLIEKGADISIKSRLGFDCFMYACMYGTSDEIVYLLDHGAILENKALMVATIHNRLANVELLLSLGIEMDAVNEKGHSALNAAVHIRHYEIAACLVEHGASINLLFEAEFDDKSRKIWELDKKTGAIVKRLSDLTVENLRKWKSYRLQGIIT
jgi:ankyrin repeat protein